jgi:hypothetical protein
MTEHGLVMDDAGVRRITLAQGKVDQNQVRGLLQAPIDPAPQMRCWLDWA